SQTAKDAYQEVVEDVGANEPASDPVDSRIINEVKTGTATGSGAFGKPGIIDSPTSVGGLPEYKVVHNNYIDNDIDGIPDYWELRHGLNPYDSGDVNSYELDPNYTNLEVYLEYIILSK